jgi:hypothetical protein
MGQAGLRFAAGNVASCCLEFSPPSHGNIATGAVFQSISGSRFNSSISGNSRNSACGKIFAGSHFHNPATNPPTACTLSGSIRHRFGE